MILEHDQRAVMQYQVTTSSSLKQWLCMCTCAHWLIHVWVLTGNWRWTEKPGVLLSMDLQRVRHDWGWTDWLIGWQKIKHMFLVSDLVTWGATIWDNLMQRMHDLMYFFSPSPDKPLASSCHTFSPHQLSQPRAILTLREVAMHHPDLCYRSHSGIHLPKLLTVLAFTIFSGVALWEMLHSRLCPLPVLMWVKDLAYCLKLGQLEMASPAADYLMFFAKV